jgi:hypothetical protein
VWLRASERIWVIDLGIGARSLIFGDLQRPIDCHFAAHYQPNMDVTMQRKSVNMEVIRWLLDGRDTPKYIFFDS